ncbi:MAG TPA: crotonase/enoyl-CoA hydratase family protein [Acidimicrobiales bacterium]|nr:crotonase/enoyl-CoA hydratase family protein [Acidimicrobiales bacterium]
MAEAPELIPAVDGDETVLVERRGNVLIVRFNRPEARNAVNGPLARGVEAAIDMLDSDPALWVGVITGTREFFSAGADLKLINAGRAGEMTTERGGFGGLVVRERVKPLIAAVEGPALAGGLEMALACDMVVASRSSRFGIPEVKRSLLAGAGGLVRLPRALPRNVAFEMAMTGDPIDAERAYQLGLVNVLTEPGAALEGALGLAERVSANAPVAVQRSRALLVELRHADDREGIRRSAEEMVGLFTTEDFSEGLTAFIEKRPPRWKGR